MNFIKRDITLVISKNIEIKRLFRDLIPRINFAEIKIQSSIEEAKIQSRAIKTIFTDIILKEYLQDLRTSFPQATITVITELQYSQNFLQMYQWGIDFVLNKPLCSQSVESIIYKNSCEMKDSNCTMKYHGISLNTNSNFAIFNGCKINLSTTESLLLYVLLKKNKPINTEDLKDEICKVKNKNLSETYTRIYILRLRKKFKEISNLNIIKNRYGKGYYISV